MTVHGALGGLLDRARGADSGVRPALGPRFAPHGLELAEPDDTPAPLSAFPGDATGAVGRERSPALASPASSISMAEDDPTDDHAPPRADDKRAAPGNELPSQSDAAVPFRAPASAEPPRDSPGDAASLRGAVFEPEGVENFVECRLAREDQRHRAPNRHSESVTPETPSLAGNLEAQPLPPSRGQSARLAPPMPDPPAWAQETANFRPQRPFQPARAAPPDVQVNIGRVEVRAAAARAPVAAAPAPAASSGLSLHAYLQRSRGGQS